jgi:hypothetical protein
LNTPMLVREVRAEELRAAGIAPVEEFAHF